MYLKNLAAFAILCFYSKVYLATSFLIIPRLVFKDVVPYRDYGNKTIGELKDTGRNYRHPDSPFIRYPLVVEEPLGTINETLKIGIVGGGVAGISAIYELSRIEGAKNKISVTLFDLDPDHFTSASNFVSTDTFRLRAGRVFSAESIEGGATQAVYELGAMRFPNTAGLTWHYANQVFKNTSIVEVFPNPGTVPTEFVEGERVDRFVRGEWLDENSPTKKVAETVELGLFGNKNEADENVSLFPIGGKDPFKFSNELKSENITAKRLEEMRQAWKIFATDYDNTTVEAAITKIIKAKIDKLPDVAKLKSNDRSAKINYYIALFGRIGFGTGGFRPFFSTALVDVIRELTWEYDNVYYLPTTNNLNLISELYYKAISKLNVTVKRARVCDAFHLDDDTTNKTLAGILHYNVSKSGEEEHTPNLDKFDYVILAITPKQLNSMVRRAGFENKARNVVLGDYQRQYAEPLKVRPPLVLSNLSDAYVANSEIPVAINQINMMTSSKIFATVKKSEYTKNAAKFRNQTIKAIISDCGLGTSYVIPSKTNPEYYGFLLSYAWAEETKTLQSELLKYPKNGDINDPKNQKMIDAIINRTIRDILDPGDPKEGKKPAYTRWWLGDLLGKVNSEEKLINVISYDWTTHVTSGGFKKDLPGDYYNSHLLFRYHTHALRAETLKNKFFIAGESYSHLGGWIEGAVMSSINAVCGLIVAANGGDVTKLNPEAQKVMTTFDPVA